MKPVRVVWLVSLCAALFVEVAVRAQDSLYLGPGTGVSNVLRIGDRRPAAQAGSWQRDRRVADLEYQTTPDGIVVVVRCDTPKCVTAQGIRVGNTESDVLRRYGAPRAQAKTAEGVYYEYGGIGFEIAGGSVRRIYAFPMERK